MTKRSKIVRRGYGLFSVTDKVYGFGIVTKRTPAYSCPIAIVDMSPAAVLAMTTMAMRALAVAKGFDWDATSIQDAIEAKAVLTALFGRLPKLPTSP